MVIAPQELGVEKKVPPIQELDVSNKPILPMQYSEPLTISEVTDTKKRKDSRIPGYTLAPPNWAVQILGSAKALGGKDLVTEQAGSPTRSAQVSFSYQPPVIQKAGVLSLGVQGGIFPISTDVRVASKVWSVWSAGLDLRYQARYFREQPVVPFLGLTYQRLAYRFESGASGVATLTGPVFGGMVLLNVLEPDAASEFYIRQGILRSYLVAEIQSLSGTSKELSISGRSYFFGLRFEF